MRRLAALILLLFCVPLGGPALAAENPFDETIRILERWTSAHWGRDCFVWVVHYPSELIEPWVEAEALKTGMTDAEKQAYRKAFVSELKLEDAETFLVSIYSFGPRPVSIAPVADNVALVTASGERLRPTRYDSGLDSPAGGIVQGLVFFPKQRDAGFAVAVKGMGVHEERIFSFNTPRFTEASAPPKESEPDVVVVDLPKRVVKAPVKKQAQPAQARRTVEPAPETPPPPAAPREIPPLFAEDSRDMAAFVQSVREGAPAAKPDEPKKEEPKKQEGKRSAPAARTNSENAYVSREYVLRHFLTLWAGGKAEEMYDMLSEGSKKVISRENFAKEVAKASDLRAGLKGNYRIEWIGEERARVVTDRRVLMIRSLVTRTLGVTREDSSWRIVW